MLNIFCNFWDLNYAFQFELAIIALLIWIFFIKMFLGENLSFNIQTLQIIHF